MPLLSVTQIPSVKRPYICDVHTEGGLGGLKYFFGFYWFKTIDILFIFVGGWWLRGHKIGQLVIGHHKYMTPNNNFQQTCRRPRLFKITYI